MVDVKCSWGWLLALGYWLLGDTSQKLNARSQKPEAESESRAESYFTSASTSICSVPRIAFEIGHCFRLRARPRQIAMARSP